MNEVDLTHGGFYKQFASKEALFTEAARQAFADLEALLAALDSRHGGDRAAARSDLVGYYLSAEHRDDASAGCPTTGLSSDLARSANASAAKSTYAEGVESFARWLGGEDADQEASDEAIRSMCALVGALVVARAASGTALSDRVLGAARAGTA